MKPSELLYTVYPKVTCKGMHELEESLTSKQLCNRAAIGCSAIDRINHPVARSEIAHALDGRNVKEYQDSVKIPSHDRDGTYSFPARSERAKQG